MADDLHVPLLAGELGNHRLQLPFGCGSQEFRHDCTMRYAASGARAASPARRLSLASSGKTLAGFSRHAGSNTLLMRICTSRSVAVELRRHQLAFLDADAVLAGQTAAKLDAEPQNGCARNFRPVGFIGAVGIVENERVEIAVAGVEDVRDLSGRARRRSGLCASARAAAG